MAINSRVLFLIDSDNSIFLLLQVGLGMGNGLVHVASVRPSFHSVFSSDFFVMTLGMVPGDSRRLHVTAEDNINATQTAVAKRNEAYLIEGSQRYYEYRNCLAVRLERTSKLWSMVVCAPLCVLPACFVSTNG